MSGRWPRESSEKQKQSIIKMRQTVYDLAIASGTNNIAMRHAQQDAIALDQLDSKLPVEMNKPVRLPKGERFPCYSCNSTFKTSHAVYIYCCQRCGTRFHKNRNYLRRNLTGQTALVSGGRTKLGHQTALKLARSGANVWITTRKPQQAKQLFARYEPSVVQKIFVYEKSLDLDVDNLESELIQLRNAIEKKHQSLDILVNCAAQTIRSREKSVEQTIDQNLEKNRYGDLRFADSAQQNSWEMTLLDVVQEEMQEAFRVNAIAPLLMCKVLYPLMHKSEHAPYIINVHAREGLFDVVKSGCHPHTNMAKSALHQLTKMLIAQHWTTAKNVSFRIVGTDPGWISVDEYYKDNLPWPCPPLDERDGAINILYPLLKNRISCARTQRVAKNDFKY